MKPPETSDPLDELLWDSDQYISDDGFTTRVLAALPKRRLVWLRPAILLGAALIGFLLVALCLPQLAETFTIEPAGGIVLHFTPQSLLNAAALLLVSASLFWCVYAALKWED